MDQAEHPADTTLELARRSSLIPVETPPVHKLSPWGFVHYGQSRKIQPFISTNVVLGNRYASTELEVLQYLAAPPDVRPKHGFDNVDFSEYTITPDRRMVMELLRYSTPLERRMHYRQYLEQELDHAEPNSKREIGLQLERRLWRMFDFAEMEDKLDRGLEWPLKQTLHAERAHWLWMLPLVRGHATPTTPSWRNMKHVPVHRLLWPLIFPAKPFISNPQRDYYCTEQMCVNPWHFYDPADRPAQHIDGPGRGYVNDTSTGTRVKWTITDVVVLPDGTRAIECPICGERSRDRRCIEVINDPVGPPPKGGQMYCWNCYQIWKQKTHGLMPRQPRLPDKKRLETKTEREHRQFEEAQEQRQREAQGLRFKWDNEWSDGTSTKDLPRLPG